MANTTNLNLVKLSGSEKLKTYPTNQAGNMDTIDSAFGAGFGLSGNPSVNTSINNLADGLAIVANGNTHAAITSGQFVYVRNHGSLSEGMYVATANISANGTLSGSNLTADTAGGLNSVYASLNSKMDKMDNYITNTNLSASISNVDLHSLNEPGRYYIGNGCTNLPSGCSHGYIDVYVYVATAGNEYKKLVVYDYNSAKSWTQYCSGGTWGSWEEIALSLYNATSQDALSSIVNAAKLAPTGAAIAFSGDSSTGTSLVGVAGVCFGNVKNVSASRMDYMVAQPSGGRIAVGTIDPSNNNAVTIVKVFS